jgi:putative heme-binding domain-containing protein
LLEPMSDKPGTFSELNKCLSVLTGKEPDVGGQTDPDEKAHAGFEFWKQWYESKFRRPFVAKTPQPRKGDAEIHDFLVSDAVMGGDAGRGAKLYEMAGCNECHGGGVTPGKEGRIFGPDLLGVTQRLSREEVANAIAFPGRDVPDRFKATEVECKDGVAWVGFITEQTKEVVTLATRDDVKRIPRANIEKISPQSGSLMPQGLLGRFKDEEIRDLYAFLRRASAPAVK